MKYGLAYIATKKENNDGIMEDIPVEKMKQQMTDYIFNNWNDADLMRCKLTSKLANGFMKIIELDI